MGCTPTTQGFYFVGVVSAVVPTVTRPGWRGREEAGSSASALGVSQDGSVSPPADPQGKVSSAGKFITHETKESFFSLVVNIRLVVLM